MRQDADVLIPGQYPNRPASDDGRAQIRNLWQRRSVLSFREFADAVGISLGTVYVLEKTDPTFPIVADDLNRRGLDVPRLRRWLMSRRHPAKWEAR